MPALPATGRSTPDGPRSVSASLAVSPEYTYGPTIPTALDVPLFIDTVHHLAAVSPSSPSADGRSNSSSSAPSTRLHSRGDTGDSVHSLTSSMTCISAPGKVLIAGGYLVLDPKYQGLVLATSSRFYTCVSNIKIQDPTSDLRYREEAEAIRKSWAIITVTAAQFPAGSSWQYQVILLPPGTPLDPTYETPTEGDAQGSATPTPPRLSLKPISQTGGRNKFVEIAVAKVLQLGWEVIAGEVRGDGEYKSAEGEYSIWMAAGERLLERIRGDGVGIEAFVLADNDFYSQRETLTSQSLPPTTASLLQLAPFNPLPRPISSTNKTGLGSSAALTSSLTAALLTHLDIVTLPPQITQPEKVYQPAPIIPALDTIHALSQLSHCLAQGKVGSGFDVSSAVYGSHSYKRFSPGILEPLMCTSHLPIYPPITLTATATSTSSTSPTPSPTQLPPTLSAALARSAWDQETLPFRLPRGFRLILADVDAGTDTPSFVGKVLKYSKDPSSDAGRVFEVLDRANGAVRDAIEAIRGMEGGKGYDAFLERYGQYPVDEINKDVPLGVAIDQLSGCLETVRRTMRVLGAAADVPIEPPEQTALLDACCQMPGVIGGGVPGAGGYDALFLIAIDQPIVLQSLQDEVWSRWTELKVSPLLARQSDGGMRVEVAREVRGLGEAVWGCLAKRNNEA